MHVIEIRSTFDTSCGSTDGGVGYHTSGGKIPELCLQAGQLSALGWTRF